MGGEVRVTVRETAEREAKRKEKHKEDMAKMGRDEKGRKLPEVLEAEKAEREAARAERDNSS